MKNVIKNIKLNIELLLSGQMFASDFEIFKVTFVIFKITQKHVFNY